MQKLKVTLFIIALALSANTYAKSVFPKGDPQFYYEMGGGSFLQDTVSPGTRVYDVGGDLSFGLSCGAFDGKVTLANLLNDYKGNVENIKNSVLSNIKAGIMAYPMAAIARANPKLYNMVHNNLLSAHKQFEIDSESCSQIEQEAAMGNNPYQRMFQQSRLNFWRDEQEKSGGDVSLAKKEVAKKIKKNGIVWIDGMKGGLNQAPVNVISDTVTAGYNIIVNRKSDLLNEKPAPKSPQYAALYSHWESPKQAREWIVASVGDEKISQKNKADDKNTTTPGFGLLPATQAESNVITENLNKLISGEKPMTDSNLESVSSSSVLITPSVISTIRNNTPTRQAILVQKISDEVATQNTLEKALWAKKLLRIGGQVPEILAADVAQERIQQAVTRINDEMQDLILSNQVASTMSSRTISQILNFDKMEKEAALRQMGPNADRFKLEGGAMKTGKAL